MRGIGLTMVGLIILIATGCSAGSLGSEANWTQGKGDLPAQIGEIDIDHAISDLPSVEYEDLWKKTGHADPTGQWFLYNGQGKLGYGISGGTNKAGSEITVSVSSPYGEIQLASEPSEPALHPVAINIMSPTIVNPIPLIMISLLNSDSNNSNVKVQVVRSQ